MIDWEHLDNLRADMGDGFGELVEVFLEEVDGAIAALDPKAKSAKMAANLHFLKGAALNLGFTTFAALCAAGEVKANNNGSVDLSPVLDSFATSRAEFIEGLKARRAA